MHYVYSVCSLWGTQILNNSNVERRVEKQNAKAQPSMQQNKYWKCRQYYHESTVIYMLSMRIIKANCVIVMSSLTICQT